MTAPIDADIAALDVPGPAISRLATMPRVDLMPVEIAERKAFRRLQWSCVAGLVACVAVVASLDYQAHHSVRDAQEKVVAAQAAHTTMQRRVSALSSVDATYARVESAKALVGQTLAGEVRWSEQLRTLSTAIPTGIWFTTLSVAPFTGQTAASTSDPASTTALGTTASTVAMITFAGLAPSRDAVAMWIEAMDSQHGFSGATFSTTTETVLGGARYVNFSGTVTVTSAAESGRYTTAGQ